MSDNDTSNVAYRPIYLNKGSYSSNGKSTIIKKYKVKERKNQGKI